ncbi:sulfur carrier protein ThiS [Butyricicoccus sp.]|uniref:sulfur carrier protein ThiS n=1 Tax=Butyricicoccus sp. TaxID=2049021 RepID=UPI0037368E06
MTLIIAGEKKEYAEGTTVAQLIAAEKISDPQSVSVSINEEFLRSNQYDSHVLKDGDEIEFLYFMGGGC